MPDALQFIKKYAHGIEWSNGQRTGDLAVLSLCKRFFCPKKTTYFIRPFRGRDNEPILDSI